MKHEDILSLSVQELPLSWKLKTFMTNHGFANLREMLQNSFWDLVVLGCELSAMTELYLFLEKNKALSAFKSNE
jgi:hypothetical protein